MLVSGRVNACRIEFSHTQLRPSVPNKSNSHRTKLHSALVDAFAQSAYPEKNSQILANWESLGWFHAISLSIWTSIAKFHILITEVPPSNETSLLTAACQRLSYFFQGLLRKPKQHQVKRNQEQHCDKNEDTYFHLYVHAKYTIQIRSHKYYAYINTQYTSFHLISRHIPIVSDIPSTGEPYRHPPNPQSPNWCFHLSVLETLTNLQGNLPPHILLCCSSKEQGAAYHGCMIMSWGKYTYKFRF